MSDRQKNFTQPWWQRRLAYAVVGAALLVLAGLGIIDEGQVDSIAQKVAPIIGTVGLWLAAAKTNPGSDSTVTVTDVERAGAAARQDVQSQIASIHASVQEQVAAAVANLPDSVRQAVEGIYNEPYGRHDVVDVDRASEPDESGPGIYPGVI